jgi:hypothetical protein
MNGPGRKSLGRRVQELELLTPKKGGGKHILFEHELVPGERPKPWFDIYGCPRPPVVIRLDTRPAMIPEEDLAYIEELETSGTRREEAEETGWWTAFQLPGEEVN